jgi:hypothetical protein
MTDRRSHVHGETTCRIYERQCSRRVNLRMGIGIFIAMATSLDIKMCESRPARNHCLGDRHLSLFSQLDWKWCGIYRQLILHRVLRASTPFLVYRSRRGVAQNYRIGLDLTGDPISPRSVGRRAWAPTDCMCRLLGSKLNCVKLMDLTISSPW